MLEHSRNASSRPERVVVLGAGGFVGGAIVARLREDAVPVLALARAELDLLAADAGDKLAAMLKPSDALAVISARAPVKTPAMLEENISMMRAVCDALGKSPVDHIVYVSSDAVYADFDKPMTETFCAEPSSLHGAMHLAREIMLRSAAGKAPLAILRPTLIYGKGDPHNGYGPNQFRRKAARGEEIVLFGNGEERRDHVLVDDVAEIAVQTLYHRSAGVLNVATGEVISFRAIADQIAAMKPGVEVRATSRNGPMPHNGYRAFDVAAIRAAFPAIAMTAPAEGFKRLGVDPA